MARPRYVRIGAIPGSAADEEILLKVLKMVENAYGSADWALDYLPHSPDGLREEVELDINSAVNDVMDAAEAIRRRLGLTNETAACGDVFSFSTGIRRRSNGACDEQVRARPLQMSCPVSQSAIAFPRKHRLAVGTSR